MMRSPIIRRSSTFCGKKDRACGHFHHFTHPQWFLRKTPWHSEASVARFLEFAEKVVSSLRGVRYWVTVNEPYVLLLGGYLDGCMPPGIRNTSSALRALRSLLVAHGKTYDMIHAAHPEAQVGIAHNMAVFAPCRSWNPLDRFLSRAATFFYNHSPCGCLSDRMAEGALPVFEVC